ncbi:MAG: ABC transporter ATP-binding protein [Sulfolobaceae archaeon]|nr:ABC transporter ATP-binding protein [Sulfolobaceae archaeon]
MNYSIIVEDLWKRYGSENILNGISINVEKGGITALLGPNGSGKTTTIRIIVGLIFPDRGKVEILGHNPFRDKDLFKKVGYVQEIPNLPGFFTARQLLEFSASMKGVSRSEVRRVLELVELKDVENKKIAKFSKGMVQRLAIAEALLGSPEVLILDEPYMGTDPIITMHIRDLIRRISKEYGVSVLMTSHIMEDVKELAQDIYVIYKGRIIFHGTKEDLVKQFLGTRVIIESRNLEALKRAISELNYVSGIEDIDKEKIMVTLKEDKREELLDYLISKGVKVKSFYLDLDLDRAYERAVKGDRENNPL